MPNPTAMVFNVQRFSTEDGPGIRTTVFFKGCPLRCLWCHNPEGLRSEPEVVWEEAVCLSCGDCQAACPQNAIQVKDGHFHLNRSLCQACGNCQESCPSQAISLMGRNYSQEELLKEVIKDKTFYLTSQGGVTLSGGEPLMQAEFVAEFAERCHHQGIDVALDTSGFGRQESLVRIVSHIQLVLFDLKVMDPAKHRHLTGVPLEHILTNLEWLSGCGIPIWVRTPIIPGCTDDEDNLVQIARTIRKMIPEIARYDLLAFSNFCGSKYKMLGFEFPLAGRPLVTREHLDRLCELVRKEGVDVVRWSGPTRLMDQERT